MGNLHTWTRGHSAGLVGAAVGAVSLLLVGISAAGQPVLVDADGDGHPLFGNPVYRTGGNPLALAAGDLDGDGDQDLAVALSGGGGEVAVMLNRGDGMFAPTELGGDARYAVGGDPRSIDVGDLDDDGDLDIVAAITDAHSIAVCFNNGDGTFAAASEISVGFGPRSVAVGDLNGDGLPDVTTLNTGGPGAATCPGVLGSVSVLLNTGAGVLAPSVEYVDVGLVGDYSLGYRFGGTAHVLRDLDGDGDLDLAAGVAGPLAGLLGQIACPEDKLAVLLNDGTGVFGVSASYASGIAPFGITAGDVDNDGDTDLLAANSFASTISVLPNNGDGTFGAPVAHDATSFPPTPLPSGSTGHAPLNLAAGDVDGDGALDVAVGFVSGAARVSLLMGNGDGTFEPEAPLESVTTPGYVGFTDLDADGDLDLFVGDSEISRSVSTLFNDGEGGFLTDQTIGDSYQQDPAARSHNGLASGDLDGDGDVDLVFAAGQTGNFSVVLNNGDGTFAPRVPYASQEGWTDFVGLSDLDGDGDLDLVQGFPDAICPGGATGATAVSLNNGDGTFAPAILYCSGTSGNFLSLGDVNGDGFDDLVTATYPTDAVAVTLNNQDGTFASPTEFALGVGFALYATTVADFNGDSFGDVVVGVAADKTIFVLLSDVAGVLAVPVSYTAQMNVRSLASGDFDEDGDLDLAVGAWRDGSQPGPEPDLEILLNAGDGTFASAGTHRVPGTNPQADHVAVADINGDGSLDVIISNGGMVMGLSVLLGNGDGTFGNGVLYDRGSGSGFGTTVAADFDGDGNVDLATTNSSDDTISILWNNAGVGCPGDVNGDGGTDGADLSVLIGSFGSPVPPGTSSDVNGDGVVDAADLSVVISGFGCGSE